MRPCQWTGVRSCLLLALEYFIDPAAPTPEQLSAEAVDFCISMNFGARKSTPAWPAARCSKTKPTRLGSHRV